MTRRISRETLAPTRETEEDIFFSKSTRENSSDEDEPMLFSPPFSHRNFTRLYFENEITKFFLVFFLPPLTL